MSNPDLGDISTANEIDLSVRGRKSGQEISRPVWFVHDENRLYLLPVQGSDTNWYRNVLKNPRVKISAKGQHLSGNVKTVIDDSRVKQIIEKFRLKYGDSDIKRYYSKLDVGVEFSV